MKNNGDHWPSWVLRGVLLVLLAASLVGLAACKSRETELPFETIERSDYGDYSVREPRVVLVTSQDEIERLEGLISQATLDQLAELDFGQYFAIAVFRGRRASSGYDTIIERVAWRGDKIVVYAQFWDLSPHYGVTLAETSPYHLIKVCRDGGVIQETELVLQSRVVTPTPPF